MKTHVEIENQPHEAKRANRSAKWFLLAGTILVGGALIALLLLVRASASRRMAGDGDHEASRSETSEGALAKSRRLLAPFEPLERPREEPRHGSQHPLPPGGLRAWSDEPIELAAPEPGEEAPVRAHHLDAFDPTKPGPPPNPFIPPKQQLSMAETRAGLDAAEVSQ